MATTPWTEQENRDLIELYFYMLDRAISGQPYNKAAMIRDATGRDKFGIITNNDAPLIDRSRGSIEAKLMNASAAHRDLVPGATATMAAHGYKAWGNYQASLKDAMREGLEARWLITAEGVA